MKNIHVIVFFVLIGFQISAQSVGISESGNSPDPSAIFDVYSNTKGVLMPRMTSSQKEDIENPAMGLVVFDTNSLSYWYFNGEEWIEFGKSIKFEVADCVSFETTIDALPQPIFEDCGKIYDSGSSTGPYNDGENYVREIVGDSGGSIRRVVVNSVVLDPSDTLEIYTIISSHVYTGINVDMDTLYLPANESVIISFKSDSGPSTGDGFEITWDTYEATTSNTESRFGFYCNSEKQSIGGGIQLNNEWGDGSGFRNVNFGVFSNTEGESSIAIGTFSRSMEQGTAIGETSFAENGAVAIGFNSIANQFRAISLGHAQALGINSIAIGETSKAQSDKAIAIGNLASASGESSIAIGDESFADGNNNVVVGNNSSALGSGATVIGSAIVTSCDDCIILGKEGFGAPKIGINKLDPSSDLDVGGDIRAEKLEIQGDFGEVSITSNDPTLHPKLSLYKNASFDLVGNITSNLSNELVFSSGQGILNEGNTFVSGTLSTSSLTGTGNRDVYVNGQGRLIEKPVETKYYSIPPSAFVSTNEDDYGLKFGDNSVAVDALIDEAEETQLYAPVHLPDGADIQSVSYVYSNNLEEIDIDFRLMRRIRTFVDEASICHVIGAGGVPTYTEVTCADVDGSISVIDNENYVYYIRIGDEGDELPTTIVGRFHSVRIEYLE